MSHLRIHFTDADIARTRLKLGIDHLWEIVSCAQLLQHDGGGLAFDPWRRRVRERVSGDRDLAAALRTLMAVAPHAVYFPDFLTPPLDLADLDTNVEAVLSTPARRLRAEVARIRPVHRVAADWLDDLGRGRPAAVRQLRWSVTSCFRELVEPHLPVIEASMRIDCAEGFQRYLRAGPEGLLHWLGRGTVWEPPVLTVGYPHDRDLWLDGRGLLLIPSYFCVLHPVALADPGLRQVLVFPLSGDSRLLAARAGDDHLNGLLGTTRTQILRAAVAGATTSALAKLADVSPATVSHHTKILRGAGLITTNRAESHATHLITPLGLDLLSADHAH